MVPAYRGLIAVAMVLSAAAPGQELVGERISMGRGGATGLGSGTSRGSVQRTLTRAMAGTTVARPNAGPSPMLLGSIATASPAESVAIYGNFAYVCDDNEISIVNISNPSSPQLVGTLTNPLISKSADIHCAIQRNTLVIFADQNNTTIGDTPAFLAFNLNNHSSPQLIAATSLNKRFFMMPVYIGNYAFVPIWSIGIQFATWDSQNGDLLSVDVSNFAAPQVVNTLEQPQLDPVYGGATVVMGVTQAETALLYIGGSSSTGSTGQCFGCGNLGSGRLQIVDVSVPTSMKLAGQLLVSGTKQLAAPVIRGTVGPAIGNNGGFTGAFAPNDFAGNVVVATFDLSDRRQPATLSITTTNYKPHSDGSGGTRIGNNLFAFPGVSDANNNPVLLIVDATNPQSPAISSIPLTQAFTSVQAAGSLLYATLGNGGFAIYSIPRIRNTPPSTCPTPLYTAIVVDRGMAIPAQAFQSAQAALAAFVNTLHLPSDHVAVVSFTTSGALNQPLTPNGALAHSAIAGIVPGGTSYIGAGIAPAQAELSGPNHNPAAFPVIVGLSDCADLGAPNPNAH